jgi:uncharacterized protein (TIGR02466 family)
MSDWAEAAELNGPLRDFILTHESDDRGIRKSNLGGWHSKTGKLEFCGDIGRRLVQHILAVAGEATQRFLAEEHQKKSGTANWTFEAWANVSRTGNFNKMHMHRASSWSGTYYVDTGDPVDPNDFSQLELIDPCGERGLTFLRQVRTSVRIRPRAGLLVLFPSYVPHMVVPHNGSRPRISIAFNLRHEPYP